MSKVHLEIEAYLGHTTKRKGTVTIDRASRTISVKQRFGRDEFILTLDEVADMIALKILHAKGREGQATKKRRRVHRGLLSIGR